MDFKSNFYKYSVNYEKYKKNKMSWNELNDFYDHKPYFCENGKLGKLYIPAKTRNIQIRENLPKFYVDIDPEWLLYWLNKDYGFVKKRTKIKHNFVETEIYNKDRIVNVRCNRWHCPNCRKRNKS